jgi:hypothetical protein
LCVIDRQAVGMANLAAQEVRSRLWARCSRGAATASAPVLPDRNHSRVAGCQARR